MNTCIRMTATLTLLACLNLLMAGCQAPVYTDYAAFVRDPKPLVTATEYRMAPPDIVMVSSRRVRELNNHREVIRADGKITLPLLGNVFVAGRTPEEVSAEIENMAREYYQDADVTLRVIDYRSKKVFVFGEVARSGPVTYNGTNTLLQTLADAQPTRLADPERIQILRPTGEGEGIKRMTIDLNAMIKRGDTTLNAVLEEGDIIFVPANPLSSTAIALQQLLSPLAAVSSVVQQPVNIDTAVRSKPFGSVDRVE